MRWLAEWRALVGRIEGLARGAEGFLASLAVRNVDDFYLAARLIGPAGQRLVADLQRFVAEYGNLVPASAAASLQAFLDLKNAAFSLSEQNPPQSNMQLALALRAVASEVDYYLGDTEIAGRTVVDRAFLHLRRSIVVDDALRRKWSTTLEKHGETGCEKLGSLHLLGHGIFAFKAAAPRAVTDLILHEPANTDDARKAGLAVLTEWKVARTHAEVTSQLEVARGQAAIYAGGVLGGVELRKHRYLVIVSPMTLAVPGEFTDGEVVYYPVGLPLDGAPASVAAQGLARKRSHGGK